MAGHLDYAIINVDTLKTAKLVVSQAKVNWSDVSIAFQGPVQATSLGFSNTNMQGAEARTKFNDGMAIIRKSGQLKEIMKACEKYLNQASD